MADPCGFVVWRGDYLNPPEFCPNDAEPGEDYCLDHLPWEPDPDAERDQRLALQWEGDFD